MPHRDNTPPLLKKAVRLIEIYIIKVLIALMSVLLILATVELGYVLVKAIIQSGDDHFILNLDNLMNVFGVFLLVVIGIELLDTIKVYFRKHVIHVEVVMLVAIIAIARKIIVMDFEQYQGLDSIGIAAIMLALAGGYFLIKKTGGCGFWPKESEDTEDIVIEEKVDSESGKIIERKKIIKKRSEENPIPPLNDPQKAGQMKDPRLSDRPAGKKSKS